MIKLYCNSRVDQIASFSVDFLNFDFSIDMARIGQLSRSRVARRFAAFHLKDASLETAMYKILV